MAELLPIEVERMVDRKVGLLVRDETHPRGTRYAEGYLVEAVAPTGALETIVIEELLEDDGHTYERRSYDAAKVVAIVPTAW